MFLLETAWSRYGREAAKIKSAGRGLSSCHEFVSLLVIQKCKSSCHTSVFRGIMYMKLIRTLTAVSHLRKPPVAEVVTSRPARSRCVPGFSRDVMYVCMYVCTTVCMCVCMYVRSRFVCVYVCMLLRIYVALLVLRQMKVQSEPAVERLFVL